MYFIVLYLCNTINKHIMLKIIAWLYRTYCLTFLSRYCVKLHLPIVCEPFDVINTAHGVQYLYIGNNWWILKRKH